MKRSQFYIPASIAIVDQKTKITLCIWTRMIRMDPRRPKYDRAPQKETAKNLNLDPHSDTANSNSKYWIRRKRSFDVCNLWSEVTKF